MTLDETAATERRGAWADPQRRGRLIIGGVSLVVGAAYWWQALLMPQGSPGQPGPGLWPGVVGAAWVVISLIVIVEAAVSEQVGGDVDFPKGRQRRDVVVFYILTVVFAVTIPLLGIYIAGALYAIALIKLTSDLAWWKVVVFGGAIGAFIPWVFAVVLRIPLPLGILDALL